MQAGNTAQTYGWVSITLHWLMAIALIGMYSVGTYMVDLDYYDPLYHTLPALHKATGISLALLLMLRLAWKYAQPQPMPVASSAPAITEQLAKLGHLALYGLLILLIISGYLISTAKGHGISVVGLFEVPALLPVNQDRGELAGDIHEILANLFIFIVGVHALAALIHHFYWKDNTLKRMLGKV